ncbi:substrate-binding periplasmic protein [Pseudomonas sp. Pseu.R1]|uniref:substrate-binding periplasmic protein n=1 Tax=Pseudomonas sp. Pseu.R1 TaxID=3379818 RepID=UPI003B949CFB
MSRPQASTKLSLNGLYLSMALLLCFNAQADTLQVVTEDSSYSSLENGKVVGVASELVEKTLARAGITDYHMSLYPWARAYDMARLEPNVLIYPIIRSTEREPLFKWVGELDHVTPLFYKLRTRRDVVVNTLQDAKNYTVGVIRDDSRQEYLEGKGFSKMVVSSNNLDNLRKLLSGQVMLVPMPEREAREQCDDLHIDFDELESVYTLDELSKGLYVALSAKTPDDTVKRITTAFAQLKDDGTVAKVLAQ